MQNDLNIFKEMLVTYLNQKSVERHKNNSLFRTASAAHNKNKVFPNVEFLYATINDVAQFIACILTKPN